MWAAVGLALLLAALSTAALAWAERRRGSAVRGAPPSTAEPLRSREAQSGGAQDPPTAAPQSAREAARHTPSETRPAAAQPPAAEATAAPARPSGAAHAATAPSPTPEAAAQDAEAAQERARDQVSPGDSPADRSEPEAAASPAGASADKEEPPIEAPGRGTEATMGDSDLDDMLDDAFDELDILDDVADDLLLEQAAEDTKAPPAQVVASRATQPSRQPKTWQDALCVLDPQERVEWAKTISKDISLQAAMQPQTVYSNAYRDGEGGRKENAVSAIVQGGAVLTPLDPKSLMQASLKKAILMVCKRDEKGFAPSEELQADFNAQVRQDMHARLHYFQVEADNVREEPERFPECAKLLA